MRNSGKTATIGCGYRQKQVENGVIIYPTTNWGDCKIKFGIGNASFTFDPKNPPPKLKQIITADASGEILHEVDFSKHRHTRVFDAKTEETITEDGTTITYTKLENLEDVGNKISNYQANGVSEFPDFANNQISRTIW